MDYMACLKRPRRPKDHHHVDEIEWKDMSKACICEGFYWLRRKHKSAAGEVLGLQASHVREDPPALNSEKREKQLCDYTHSFTNYKSLPSPLKKKKGGGELRSPSNV